MRVTRSLPLLACAILLTACAVTQADTGTQRDVILADEIRETRAHDAYEIVELARPQWLQKRGAQVMNGNEQIIIYLNGTRMGGVDALRQISAGDVTSIRFFDASAAQFHYGTGHMHGAIAVSTSY